MTRPLQLVRQEPPDTPVIGHALSSSIFGVIGSIIQRQDHVISYAYCPTGQN